MKLPPFTLFEKTYTRDITRQPEHPKGTLSMGDERAPLFGRFGGQSFNRGLYRIFTSVEAEMFDEVVFSAFPEYRGKCHCFGYDWLGRVFAHNGLAALGKSKIMCFVVGTGEVLDIQADIIAFHDEELVQYPDDAVAATFFESWLQAQPSLLERDRCVGYKRPLFLGGEDCLENLEETDLEVYWHVMGQLWQKVKSLPVGTKIDKIVIE
jgi:hypothetical protein